jgi:hypothetical protein
MRKILPLLFIPFALGLWLGGANSASAAPLHINCRSVVVVYGFHAADCYDLLNLLNQQCGESFREGTPDMANCRSRAQQAFSDCLNDQRHCNPNAMGSMLGC